MPPTDAEHGFTALPQGNCRGPGRMGRRDGMHDAGLMDETALADDTASAASGRARTRLALSSGHTGPLAARPDRRRRAGKGGTGPLAAARHIPMADSGPKRRRTMA